jgi:hypothetical protein
MSSGVSSFCPAHFYGAAVFFVEREEWTERNAQFRALTKGKDTSFIPPEGRWTAEAFQSLFSHIDEKIRDGYGEDGCGKKVICTERLIPSIRLYL